MLTDRNRHQRMMEERPEIGLRERREEQDVPLDFQLADPVQRFWLISILAVLFGVAISMV